MTESQGIINNNNYKSKVKDCKIMIVLFTLPAVAGFTQYAKAQLYDDGIPVLTAKMHNQENTCMAIEQE